MKYLIKLVLSLAIVIIASIISTLIAYAMGNRVATKGIGPYIIFPLTMGAIAYVWRYIPKRNIVIGISGKGYLTTVFTNRVTSISQNQAIICSLFIGWTFIHIIFLGISDAPYDWAVRWFWPIEADSTVKSHYDRTEFAVYVGVPVIILTVYYFLRSLSVNSAQSSVKDQVTESTK
jgi:hypothetical protein